MENAPVIIFVGLLVFLSHLFVALFERTRVPDVLYLILIGLVIGPILHVVSQDDFGKVGHVFTTIALVVILFEGGLEISLETLKSSLRDAVAVTGFSYMLAFAGTTAVVLLLAGLPLSSSLYIGAVVAGPAPAVVIPLVRQLRLAPTTRATLMLESPLGEALCIIVALAVFEAMTLESVRIGVSLGKLLSSFVFAVVFGSVGGYVWSILLHRVRQLRNAIFTTPSFLFILFGLTEFLGFSGAVAALTFGITLGNVGMKEIPWLVRRFHLTPLVYNETEKQFFGEIVFLIKTFFFVYLGLSIRFADLWTMGTAIALSIVLLLLRPIAVRYATRKATTPRHDASVMSVMVPRGTAAAVLASLPLQSGLEGGESLQNIIYGTILASILLTAFFLFLLERTGFGKVFHPLFAGYGSGLDSAVLDSEDRGNDS